MSEIFIRESDGKKFEVVEDGGSLKTIHPMRTKTFSWDDVADDVLITAFDHVSAVCLCEHLKVRILNNESNWGKARFSNKWNYWGGGEQPVPDCVIVEVKFRSDLIEEHVPSNLYWKHRESNSAIIAFRVAGLADGYVYPDEVEE